MEDTIPAGFRPNEAPIEEFERVLNEADHAYYNLDDPLYSDGQYDFMVKIYQKRFGKVWMKAGVASPELPHGKHVRPMQSLDKVHDLPELVRRTGQDAVVVLGPKVDGGGLSLDYDETGRLVRALTRGDHEEGEDVTEAALLIPDIPNTIFLGPHTVRGEVYLTDENFAIVGGVNPRNSATGTLRRKSDIGKAKYLSFVAYKAFDPRKPQHEDACFDTESGMLQWLKAAGFSIIPYEVLKIRDVTEEKLKAITQGVPYWTDGAVLTVNDWGIQRSLGLSSRSPRFAVAYKFEQERKHTKLLDIEWAATRTGRVVPTAVFEPVFLDGTTVQRATLHNKKNVVDVLGGLTIGDTVSVFKANAIIPQVEAVIERLERDLLTEDLPLPAACPSCEHPLVVEDVDLLCPYPGCEPKLVGLITNFGIRKNMDIDGLGEEVALAMVKSGVVESLYDLVTLGEHDLVNMPYGKGTFGAVRTKKLLAEFDKAREKQPWSVVLHSLGCPGLGEPECEAIAEKYGMVDLLDIIVIKGVRELEAQLKVLKGIGPVTAKVFAEWMDENYDVLDSIQSTSRLNVKAAPPKAAASDKFAGQTWVITGTLSRPRHIFEALIKDHGGTVSGSVSKKTSALLAGSDAGSKLEKAKSVGVKVVTEAEFEEMLR